MIKSAALFEQVCVALTPFKKKKNTSFVWRTLSFTLK